MNQFKVAAAELKAVNKKLKEAERLKAGKAQAQAKKRSTKR